MVFDVLRLDADDVTAQPYSERRRILECLDLDAPGWRTPDTFDDPHALWEAICEHELEGVVAKKRSGAICRASAAGSRRRTATTGATRWSGRAR
jgi:ATP-dependent DNA ligase